MRTAAAATAQDGGAGRPTPLLTRPIGLHRRPFPFFLIDRCVIRTKARAQPYGPRRPHPNALHFPPSSIAAAAATWLVRTHPIRPPTPKPPSPTAAGRAAFDWATASFAGALRISGRLCFDRIIRKPRCICLKEKSARRLRMPADRSPASASPKRAPVS